MEVNEAKQLKKLDAEKLYENWAMNEVLSKKWKSQLIENLRNTTL